MPGYRLILKSRDSQILPREDHLEFLKEGKGYVVAYRHLEGVYLDLGLSVSLRHLVKLAQRVPVFFIDHNGYIKATLCLGLPDAKT